MIFTRCGGRFCLWATRASARAGILAALLAALPHLATAQNNPAASNAQVAAYTHHLIQLQTLVTACQKQRTAEACDPQQVGPNDQVPWSPAGVSAEREISYDWLRALLAEAGNPKAAKTTAAPHTGLASPQPVVKTPPPSIDTLLSEARLRLAADAQQAMQSPQLAPDYAAQRRDLAIILARREYQGVTQTTVRERFLEWLANELDAIFGELMAIGTRSPWIGLALRALLIGGLCVLLAWVLIRIERRARIKLIEDPTGSVIVPSARDWQLWLRDAQAMAAQSLWREAIHFLYWAAIARLESRHLWPADRARTPREYLRLLPSSDPRRAGLVALTKTFERTWYGGREAGSADYQSAVQVAAELGVQ